MLTLRELVQRKARVLRNSQQARKSLYRLFEDPDSIDEKLVYSQFKIVPPVLPSVSASTRSSSRPI